MTFSELKQAIDATVVLCALILLIQAIPETVHWLVFGEWYGVDANKLLPENLIQSLTTTSFVGLNKVFVLLADVWIGGLLALLFAAIMAGAVLTRRFDNSDVMQNLMNPPTRREDIIQVHRRLDQLSEEFDNGNRQVWEKLSAIEKRFSSDTQN